MASGRIELHSTVLTDIDLGLDWVETPDSANNTSTVAITACQLKSPTYGGYWYPNGTIKINGQTVVSMDYTVATHRFYLHANNSWVDIIKWNGGSTAPPWSTGAIAHNADGSKSVVIEVNLEMWQSDPMPKPKFTVSKTVTLDKLQGKAYKLTLSQAANTTLTVTLGGKALSNGATIHHGDKLTVTFSASTGYNAACKVNGSAVSSGATHTVSGAVTAATTASLKTYKLTITQAANTTLTVKRGGTALANGATISHFDVLTVTFSASTGYNATCKVNGSAVSSGATHTVSGAVTAATTASLKTYKLTITQGANTTLMVKRGGTALTNGASISHFDKLTVTFYAGTGYNASCTVNGGAVSSGAVHTVAGAVTVVSAAALKTYTLTIAQGANTTLTVKRNGMALTNGTSISHFDKLTVTFSPAAGYNMSCKLNEGEISSGTQHTVAGAVKVVSEAALKTYTLTFAQPEHGKISVERTSSLEGALGDLKTGATIYHFDALSIGIKPDIGYKALSRTPPGDVESVTGDVTVSAVFGPMATLRIWNGTAWESFLVYVSDGTVWEQHQAYVSNGSGWESCC